MRELIKWYVAPKEMAELEAWNCNWNEYRRWLAEFKTVGTVLDTLRHDVKNGGVDISSFRDELRKLENK